MRFTDIVKKHSVEMIGTYSTFPELNWAVIAQRRLDAAESDTGVDELNRQALVFASIVVLAANEPVRNLETAARAIGEGARRGSDLVVLPELWTTGLALREATEMDTPGAFETKVVQNKGRTGRYFFFLRLEDAERSLGAVPCRTCMPS